MSRIYKESYWIDLWQSAADGSPFRGMYPDERRLWDSSARTYDAGMGADASREQKLLGILDRMDFWRGGEKRILDIGSGTGSLAIPLARRGGLVDALDSSAEMNRVLREKCENGDVGGIRILDGDFKTYELSPRSYDLVLGSMNPCLYEPRSFLEMLALSRDVVMYIGITSGQTPSRKPSKPGHNGSNHIIYPLGLLLSMGLEPTVDYVTSAWDEPSEDGTAERKTCAMGIVTCRVGAREPRHA